MSKVNVFIEEHLCRKLTFEVDEEDYNVRTQKAEELARLAIDNEQVVLTADDYNGTRLIMVQDGDNGFETEWKDY